MQFEFLTCGFGWVSDMDLGMPPTLMEIQYECEREKGSKWKRPYHEYKDEVKVQVKKSLD
jgi:hypothetical protein